MDRFLVDPWLDHHYGEQRESKETCNIVRVYVCSICGWWIVRRHNYHGDGTFGDVFALYGALRNLDLTDISIPINQLRAYLILKYEERFNVRPRRFEEIVAGVFSDFEYETRVTSISGDGGIDIIALDGPLDKVVGVQVNSYRNRIEAEQIRSFAGALMLQGITSGIFVTTSTYRRGAVSAASGFGKKGLPITLWDSEQFFDKLRISQRPMYVDVDDSTSPFHRWWSNPNMLLRVKG